MRGEEQGAPHRHRSVSDWVLLFESLDDEGTLLASCPESRSAWNQGLSVWAEHVSACPACRALAAAQERLADAEFLGCAVCRDALNVVYDLVDAAEHYEPCVVWELQRADRFLDELSPLDPDERMTRVRAEPTYQQWGFAQRLLADARDAWHRDPEVALERARLALAVSKKLDPASYGGEWIADLQAKAHAYLGNAHRILGHFPAAEEAFVAAEARLRHGVRSGQAEARIFSLKASLLNDQRRHREALALLAQVEAFYEEHGDRHEVGRVALKRSTVFDALAEPRRAAEECARAVEALDPGREPNLPLIARNNAINYLVAAGEIEQARALFDHLPPMPEPLADLDRQWLEGNLLRAEARYDEARAAYERVRNGFAEAGIFYRAAAASLDLALTAFQHAGDRGEIHRLAEEAAANLTLAGAKTEAFAALRLILQAARRDALTLAVLEDARQRLAAVQPSS